LRAIPLANPAVLAIDDPYRDIARIVCPSNVLIVCLPTDGNITLPVPQSVWRSVALVDSDDCGRVRPLATPREDTTPETTDIVPSLWTDSITSERGKMGRDAEPLITLHRSLSLPACDLEDAYRIFKVLSSNGLPAADAISVAAGVILVPRSSGDAKTIENAIRATGVVVPGWQSAFGEAQRLTT
jgi:hypothetical protein